MCSRSSRASCSPAPGDGTTIDGTTEQTFTGGNTNPSGGPSIVINGATSAQYETIGAGYQPALILRGANCTVKGFVINGFDVQGLVIMSSPTLGTVATGNVVSGCYIGTDSTGSTKVPNAFAGIEMYNGAYNNTIGGTTTAARNVISGNTSQGIYLHDVGSTNNLIEGNYLGLNAAGTAALPNGFAGIEIGLGAQNNTVGGTTTAARNIISGNTSQGVFINGSGTSGNLVVGNYIGLNPGGTGTVGNGTGNGTGNPQTETFFSGVDIYNGAQNNIIGGTTAAAANVISGNLGGGLTVSGTNTKANLIEGNYIGVNPVGTAAMGNGSGDPTNHLYYAGVSIFNAAQSNVIGGTATGASNVISGNIGSGLAISSSGTTGNLVQGNLIGTNLAGTAAIANGNANSPNYLYAGLEIFGGAQSNVVGGTVSAAKNLISGNASQGVYLGSFGTSANLIEGNFIGTNLAGTGAIANAQGIGIYSSASSNTIGGTVAGALNVISGNTGDGIAMGFPDTNQTIGPSQNTIAGNYIGVIAAGTTALANGGDGIDIFNSAQTNTIGGTVAGSRNIISGNSSAGVAISQPGSNGNLVQGNWVGLNVNSSVVANGQQGVSIFTAAQSNVVGGTAAGAGNIISGNKDAGVGLYNYDTPNDTLKDSVNGNSIFGNANLGIVLYNGANNTQAAPSLTSAVAGATGNTSGTNVVGTLTSTASSQFRLEFFWSASTANAGQNFLGSTNVTTNSSGTVSFTAALPAGVPSGNVITATATDPNGNTSAFSSTVTVATGISGKRNQTITFAPLASQPFNTGTITLNATASSALAVTYTVTGPASISGNVLTITGAGQITVTAAQAGNTAYNAATSVNQSFTAGPVSQTITFPTVASQTFGVSPISLSATASSGLAITYGVVSGPATVSGSSLTITGVGTVTVQASQGGNTNFTAASPVSQNFTVRQATQTITFPAISNQTSGGAPFTLTASSTSGLTITYVVVSGPATVSGSTLTTTGTGTVTVEANQSGNPNYFAATAVDRTFQVTTGTTTTALATDTPTMPQWALILLGSLLALAASTKFGANSVRLEGRH